MTTDATKPIILVDTNVWLDAFFPYRPHAHEARDFIDKAVKLGCNLAYPVHALGDMFYIACNEIKRKTREAKNTLSEQDARAAQDIAWSCIEYVRDMASAVGADESDAWLACKMRPLNDDLEDNFVLAAAQRANAAFLVTSDEALLRKATVEAHTPADAIKLLTIWE